MQKLQSDADLKVSENEVFLHNFQVEELEERLENKWDSTDPPYVPTYKSPF